MVYEAGLCPQHPFYTGVWPAIHPHSPHTMNAARPTSSPIFRSMARKTGAPKTAKRARTKPLHTRPVSAEPEEGPLVAGFEGRLRAGEVLQVYEEAPQPAAKVRKTAHPQAAGPSGRLRDLGFDTQDFAPAAPIVVGRRRGRGRGAGSTGGEQPLPADATDHFDAILSQHPAVLGRALEEEESEEEAGEVSQGLTATQKSYAGVRTLGEVEADTRDIAALLQRDVGRFGGEGNP